MPLHKIIIILSSLFIFSCHRASRDQIKVSLQLKNHQAQAQSCTHCLKGIFVNVDGEGLNTIIENVKHGDFSEAGTEISNEFSMDVPTGLARSFQLVAVFLESDGSMTFNYGSATVDLVGAGPVPVVISTTSLGVFKKGSIVGRYLTGPDAGPTGKVSISLTAPEHPEIKVTFFTADIINGWFNFFASENFPMTYQMADGTLLFQNVVLDDLVPVAGAVSVPYKARVHYGISSFYRNNGSGSWQFESDTNDFVYGFFGDAAYTSSKRVCIEYASTTTLFSNISSTNTGSGPLYWDDDASGGADIYGISGLASNNGSCVSALFSDRFQANQININSYQYNGNGNDTASGLSGAFTYLYSNTNNISKFEIGSGDPTYTFHAVPGVLGPTNSERIFDGAQIYKKANAYNGGAGNDDISCTDTWLSANGFSRVTSFSSDPTTANDLLTVKFTQNSPTTDGYLICPTKSGALMDYGGFFVGGILSASIYTNGTLAMTTGTPVTTSIYNLGSGIAVLSTPTLSGNVNFTGGTYPGTAGTCGQSLISFESCVLDLTCTAAGTYNLTIPFFKRGTTEPGTQTIILNCS